MEYILLLSCIQAAAAVKPHTWNGALVLESGSLRILNAVDCVGMTCARMIGQSMRPDLIKRVY